MTETGHIPSFRTPGLPPGYGRCLRCDQLITRYEWVIGVCPGTPPTDERRDG